MTVDVRADHQGVFNRDDELASAGHEQIMFCRDEATGLKAIIGIHDTARGPALGGTRFFAYASESDALTDVLRLSQGMTFKAAAADLPLGGGKAVIIGDPTVAKTPELLRAYGRFIESLGGRYLTAADVGTTSDDLDVIGEETRYVVGRNVAAGGSGDSGLSTATGVFHAMRVAAVHVWGSGGLQGRTVGVEGAGKVGLHLVGLLLGEGAAVALSDPSDQAIRAVTLNYGDDVAVLPNVIDADVDVYAPCALGGTLTSDSVSSMRAAVVCGAANNQLLTGGVDSELTARGITWVPDYVANAGGLIQVGGELQQRTAHEVLEDVARIGATTEQILKAAADVDIPTGEAAAIVVRARLSGPSDRRL